MTRPTLHDRIELWTLQLAKWHKGRYQPASGDQFYQEYFTAEHTEAYQRDIRFVLRRQEIAEWLRLSGARGLVIDVGCGVGDVLQIFQEGFTRVGTDYAFQQLRFARESLGGGAGLLQSSAYQLPFRTGVADLIVCLEVIEHLEHDAMALHEISRVLKPGGHLICAVPNHHYWPQYRDLMGHWRHYNSDSLRQLLAVTGLQPVQFLNGYERTQRSYLSTYLALKAASLLASKVSRRSLSVYSMSLPGPDRSIYARVANHYLRMAEAERREALAEHREGTFVVARKPCDP